MPYQRIGSQVWYYKRKGDPMECGSYTGIKFIKHNSKGPVLATDMHHKSQYNVRYVKSKHHKNKQ